MPNLDKYMKILSDHLYVNGEGTPYTSKYGLEQLLKQHERDVLRKFKRELKTKNKQK